MQKDKGFWIGLSLFNLSLVALFGLLMRSKMIFSIPFLDYRNLLSAHSHYAFGGWVGLALITLLIYDVLPEQKAQNRRYQQILWGIQISSLGMGLSFPLMGYNVVSVTFSSLYILVTYVFGWLFFRDLKKSGLHPVVRRLSTGSVAALLLSAIGPLGLSVILVTKSGNSLLYRDSIYTFLHLQYNGFFTLAVFAVFFSHWLKRGVGLPKITERFTTAILLSILPSLFTALLWHNLVVFYVLAGIGCLFILLSVVYFLPVFRQSLEHRLFIHPLARLLWMTAFVSFIIKMVLTIGTLYPPLGNAVYGARPVIIGFLHLVFLAFVSFFILGYCLENGFFTVKKKTAAYPFYIFGSGVVANEVLLMTQGLGVLFKTTSHFFNQALWAGSILLFVGAAALSVEFYRFRTSQKKAAAPATASL
jgi:hypothetical protein